MFSYVINERDNRVRTEDQIFNQVSLEEITWALQSNPIRILLGAIILRRIHGNCNNRLIRQIKINDYWNEEFCKFKPEIDKIKGEVKLTKIIDNYNKGDDLNIGYIYIGTTNGLYLLHRSSKIVYKENNINDEEVTSIKNFAKDKFYATTKNGDVYFLRTDRIVSDGHLIGEILPNIKSSNLNKELKLYYYNESPKIYTTNYLNENHYLNKLIHNFNLFTINPLNYKKIKFLGKDENFKKTRICWGDEPYWPNYYLHHFNGRNLDSKIITNKKVEYDEQKWSTIANYFKITLQPYAKREWGLLWLQIYQGVGLTWYWENDNYHFQVLDSCYLHSSGTGGKCFLGLGSGIKLYNDDNNLRDAEITNELLNDETTKEIQNITKWTDEFTKSINHEQHLAIDNKTNFVTSNITSL